MFSMLYISGSANSRISFLHLPGMSSQSIIPLSRERKEQILKELGSEVTNPDLYRRNVQLWHKQIVLGQSSVPKLRYDQEIIDTSRNSRMLSESLFLTDFLLVFMQSKNTQEKFNMYIGALWTLSDDTTPSLGELNTEKLMKLFNKSREVAEKLKVLNDKTEIIEWITP